MGIKDLPLSWDDFTSADLLALVPAMVLARGREYFRQGLVCAPLYTGNFLAAVVVGATGRYTVKAELREGRLLAHCTCPYQGDLCKHVVALLYTWLEKRETFFVLDRAPLFGDGDPATLRRVIRSLALAAPEEAVAVFTGRSSEVGEEKAPVARWAREFYLGRSLLHDPGGLAERLDRMARRLVTAVEAGDKEAALAAGELAGRFLAFWVEAASPVALVPPFADYLSLLGGVSLPAGMDLEEIRACWRRLFRPEALPFFGELGRLFLSWFGLPRPGELDPVAAGVVELLADCGPEKVKAVEFSSLLLVLDAYRRWGKIEEAFNLAKNGLRRTEEEERYLLRKHLAAYHQEKGERRQAMAYLLANFRSRPDEETWRSLRRLATLTGEWPRIKDQIRPLVLGHPGLRVLAAMEEEDPVLLRRVAGELGPDDPRALAVWTALATWAPEEALVYLLAATRFHLAQGGYRGRKAAAGFLRAAVKVAHAAGGEERWRQLREGLWQEFGLLLRGPEFGALLTGPEGEETGKKG